MTRKIQSLISIVVFAGLFVGGCAKAATPIATATSTPTQTLTLTPSPAPTIQPGDSKRTLTVDNLERAYLLHIPPGLDSLQPVPVVFVFHGLSMGAQFMDSVTGFNDISDTNGFLVVYPSSFGIMWNFGNCCGGIYTDNQKDDIDFVRQILIDLGTFASVNPSRIYSTGFSAGAIFTYRLACEMSDTFAAIAPVSGALLDFTCQPQQPVSVLHEHGLMDTEIDYAGGFGFTGSIFPSVEQSVATWAQLDGCNSVPNVKEQGVLTHTVYSSCRAGTAVELYTMDAQGHFWPTEEFSKIIWAFFDAHPKQ